MSRTVRRRTLWLLFAGTLLFATGSMAFFTTTGTSDGSASTGTLGSPAPLQATAGIGSATLSWTQVPSPSGTATDVSYTIERSHNMGGYGPAAGTCAGALSGPTTTCTDAITTAGLYTYQITAKFRSWTTQATSNTVSVVVDATPPTSTITFPGHGATYGPSTFTAGCTPGSDEICGTANDPGTGATGVATVEVSIQRASDNGFWNGSAWVLGQQWHLASGTTSWSYAFSGANLTNGVTYTVQSRAMDLANNMQTTPDSKSFTFDSAPPATPAAPDMTATTDSGASSTDNITNNQTPTFTGSAEAGSTVTLFDGATPVGSAVATGGNYTITSATLGSGSHAMTVRATDVAGNTSAASPALTITIDITAPAPPPAPDMTPATDSGTSTTDNITNDTTPTFTGTAEAGSTVTLLDSGTPVGTGIATGGTYTVTTSTLANGTRSITARATDVAGNQSADGAALTITIDTVAPAAPPAPDLTAATDSGSSNTDNITSDTTPDFTGTAEIGSTVTVLDGGGPSGTGIATGGTYTITATLASGVRTITVRATDAAGNQSSSSPSLTVTVDTTPPTVSSVTSSVANGTYGIGSVIPIQVVFSQAVDVTGTPQLTLETGSSDAIVNYTSGSGTNTLTFTYTVASPHVSSDLSYLSTTSLTLNGGTIRDLAGNNGTLTLPALGSGTSLNGSKNIVIDGVAPAPTVTTPASGAFTNDTTPQFAGAAGTAPGDSSTITVNVYSGAGTSSLLRTFTTTRSGSSWSVSYPAGSPTLTNGNQYTVQVTQADTVNVGTSNANTFTVDTSAPLRTALEMFDIDQDGRVDRVVATYSEPIACSGCPSTSGWSLSNIPSSGTFASVTVSGNQATLNITEGGGAPNTAVGNFAVSYSSGSAHIVDAAGNQAASVGNTAPADKAAPRPIAMALGGNDGIIQLDTALDITFSEDLDASSVCSTWSSDTSDHTIASNGLGDVIFTVTDSGAGNDVLTASTNSSHCGANFNFGSLDLGSPNYVTSTRTYQGTTNTTRSEIRWDVDSSTLNFLFGSPTGGANGSGASSSSQATYTPDADIDDIPGNAVVGTLTVTDRF